MSGNKRFELTNHLGNVMAVIGDQKLPVDTNGGGTDFYSPIVLSAQDYYPFGMLMPVRSFSSEMYRFGYNKGSEKVDEISGSGNHFTTFFREGDTRLSRWWSIDPKAKDQPWQSSYSYMDGNPVLKNDPNGDCIFCPLLIKAGAGLVAASIETGVQFSVAYSQPNATFTSALKKIDAADIGVAFFEGAATNGTSIPKILAKTVVFEGVKASVDRTQEKGFQTTEFIGGNKEASETLIDFGAGMAGTSGSTKILSSLEKGAAKDIKSGTFSTLNKSEKQTIRNVQSTVKSEPFKKSVEAVTDYGSQGFGEGLKSRESSRLYFNNPPDIAAPSDKTRVVKPIPR